MYDALLWLLGTSPSTKLTLTTASLTGSWIDLKTMPPRRGLKARFNLASYVGATAGSVITPVIETSDDATAVLETFNGTPVTAATAAVTPSTPAFVSFESGRRYVRGKLTTTLTANGPTAVVDAQIGTSRP
jgi:hypothetical protein